MICPYKNCLLSTIIPPSSSMLTVSYYNICLNIMAVWYNSHPFPTEMILGGYSKVH